jgi:hypothetical protein
MNTRFLKNWEHNKNTRIVTFLGYKLGMYDPTTWQFISYEGIDVYGDPKYVKLRRTDAMSVFHARYEGEERRSIQRIN